jgi:hypothetical protein
LTLSAHRRLGLVALAAVFAAGLFALAHATAAPADAAPCAPANLGTVTNITRAVVPIGTATLRAFTVDAVHKSNIQVTVPAGYGASPSPVSGGRFGFLFTAPQAGSFTAHFTWNQEFTNDLGDTIPCLGSGDVTLNAIAGSPLHVRAPKKTTFPGSKHTLSQYDDLQWTYKCIPTSDPAPLDFNVRFQISVHGRLNKHAKAFRSTVYDACDALQVADSVQNLGHSFKLHAGGGGSMSAGGSFYVKLEKSLTHGYIKLNHKDACLHVGVTVKQGTRTLVNKKFDNGGAGAWLPGGHTVGPLCV